MKLALEKPYSDDWDAGYLVVGAGGRRTLLLSKGGKVLSSTPYARYLMSVSLGRYLSLDETVDHIDEVRSNDLLSNLQILSRAENIRKSSSGIRVTEHGTLSMYRYCKCDFCRAAKKEHSRKYREQKAA